MVDSLWFILVMGLLAVVSAALIIVLAVRRVDMTTGRETRTEYLQPCLLYTSRCV